MAHNAHVFAYRVHLAREKFGKDFASDRNSSWVSRKTPFLTGLLADGMAKKAA